MKSLEKELNKLESTIDDGGFRKNEIAHLSLLRTIAKAIIAVASELQEIKAKMPVSVAAQPESKTVTVASKKK